MMDQLTPHQSLEQRKQPRARRWMLIAGFALLPGVTIAGLMIGVYLARTPWPVLSSLGTALAPRSAAGPSSSADASVLYYQNPEGKPLYALQSEKTEDGRSFRPVRVGEDVSFDGEAKNAQAAAAPGTVGKKILYYRNPMGLPDISSVPKKDSMGMDYIPVYAGEAEDSTTITISPGKLQRTGVRSETAERRVISRPLRVPGTVQVDERRVSVVATRSDAFIDKVENVTTGDRVREGQPLLTLYSPEINAAAAQLIANPGFDGSRRRLKNLNVSDQVIADIERTRNMPLSIQWTAPRDGVVIQRNATDGMRAAAGDVLFRIADLSVVWVLADVPERDLGQVRPGARVAIHVRSLPSRTFQGRVAVIYPQVNAQTRTTRVRIELPNEDGALLPDMYAEVEIATGTAKPVIAVSDDAVIDTGSRQIVILDQGKGRFKPREVKTGVRGGGFVELREGVSEGDKVVTSANFLIDAESNLKSALQTMTAASPSQEKP